MGQQKPVLAQQEEVEGFCPAWYVTAVRRGGYQVGHLSFTSI